MTLTDIANKYMTDKGTRHDGMHNFTSAYEVVFDDIKDNIESLLEIGILSGSSIRMWRDYFTNAQIYGVDIHQEYVNGVKDEDRIIAMQGDQSKPLIPILGDLKDLDVIIDDGSHQMDHQQRTFGELFRLVKPGGIYILEDLHTSLNPNYTDKFGGYEKSALNMFTMYEETGEWRSDFISDDDLEYIQNNTSKMEVYGWENPNNKEGMSITAVIWKK